ncbi:hypothetical protein SAMN06298211_101485 [Prevotellaceae bacterium MN60]|nr:hypothetical protein SAMN06298211_101485 [Prevotellaceae bacterium MN60]
MIRDFVLYNGIWINKRSIRISNTMDVKDANFLLKRKGLIVRNTYNWDKETPTSFWYVIKDTFGGIEELPSKVRNQVRRALKTYVYKIVTYDEMLNEGYDLFNKSRRRFGGNIRITKEQWKYRLLRDSNSEFWIGYDIETGKPASFAINTLFEDYCDYSTMGIDPDFPNNTYPMYGLIYEMNRVYLEERKAHFVCDGVRSITGHSNIQSVLEDKFKFRKAYCELQIFYKPLIGVAVKILFPFRKLIKNKKIEAVLRQEAWARGKKE